MAHPQLLLHRQRRADQAAHHLFDHPRRRLLLSCEAPRPLDDLLLLGKVTGGDPAAVLQLADFRGDRLPAPDERDELAVDRGHLRAQLGQTLRVALL